MPHLLLTNITGSVTTQGLKKNMKNYGAGRNRPVTHMIDTRQTGVANSGRML